MQLIDLKISIDTNNPEDIINQRELLRIYEDLKIYDAKFEPLQKQIDFENSTPKAGELSIIAGAVSVSIPVVSLVKVLTTFIKERFETRRQSILVITLNNGMTIKSRGYDAKEIEKLIQSLPKQHD